MAELVAVQSEASILGSMLIEPEVVLTVTSKLSSSTFTIEAHIIVMQVFEALILEHHTTDFPSILQVLELTNQLQKIGGHEFLRSLIDSVDSLTAIDTHIELVKDCSRRRASIAGLQAAIVNLESFENDPGAVWSQVYQTGLEVSDFGQHGSTHIETGHPERGLYATRIQILKARETAKVLYTGWEELDSLIPTGFARKDLSIIAARPGMGKSAFRFNLTRRFCDRGFGVAFISTEQSKEAETDRQDSILTGIAVHEIARSSTWAVGDPRLELVKKANRFIDENWNYDILFDRQLNMSGVRDWLTLVTRRREKQILLIDLFDRLTDVGVAENKASVVTRKLDELSVLSQIFDIHICLVVQINRQVERRANRRPQLSDLKDSGGYEERGRLVMLLYRDAYYNEDSTDNTLEVCISKQNQGPAGPNVIVPFQFNPETLEAIPRHGGFFGSRETTTE